MQTDKATNGSAAHQDEPAVPFTEGELAALSAAADDLMPDEYFLVGKPLNWNYETGRWSIQIGKDNYALVDDADEWLVDVRSYSEIWKRREDSKVTHQLGGRRIDGWVNCPRDQLPDQNKDQWKERKKGKDGEPKDPWQRSVQIVLKRVGDATTFVTWSAIFSAEAGMSEFLDAFARQAKDRPGLSPVVMLETVEPRPGRLQPRLRIIRWEPFGAGASPPANPKALERIQAKLRLINKELGPEKSGATPPKPEQIGDMDDEIPF
jgi:hypothetical protein